MASAAFAAAKASAQRCAAAADCASLIALTSASFLVMIAAAAWAGARTTKLDRAAAVMPMADAAKIARVDFQFIGFLFRSDAAAKARSRITKRPQNLNSTKCEAGTYSIYCSVPTKPILVTPR